MFLNTFFIITKFINDVQDYINEYDYLFQYSLDKINNFVDETIKDEKKSKTLNHGKQLAGDVKQELRLEIDFMDNIGWGKIDMSNSFLLTFISQYF